MYFNKKQALLDMKVAQLTLEGIENGNDITLKIQEEYKGGLSEDGLAFGNLFALKSAEVAVKMISENFNKDSIAQIVARLDKCTRVLNEEQFLLSVLHLNDLIEKKMPEFIENMDKAPQVKVSKPKLH